MKALYFDNDPIKIAALKAASVFAKNAALGPVSPLKYGEIEEPQIPNERWLKIRNISCGLCGTDLHLIYMDMDPLTFPAATPGIARKFLGHEVLGEIVELGSEVDGFEIGDRVGLRIDWPSCNQMEIEPPCSQCASGNYMLCENLGKKDLPLKDTGGGFSPYMVVHRSQPYKIPDGISDERALLLEPVASAVHAVYKRKPKPGEKILVIGAGTVGLLTVAVLKHLEPKCIVYCLARHDFQRNAALDLGADDTVPEGKALFENAAKITGANHCKGYLGNEILLGGFDVVFDTVGNDKSLSKAFRLVKGKGHVVLSGINFKPGKIDYTPIWNQEIQVTGINCHADETAKSNSFDVAAKILKNIKAPIQSMITHRFPMEQYKEAIATFLSKKNTRAIKIVLDH